MTTPCRRQLFFLGILGFALSACAAISALSTPEEVARRSREEAKHFEQEGRLQESLERWKIILAIDPQQAEARQKERELEAKIREGARRHIAAGKEQLQQRKKEGAQREFLAALRLDPSNREALEQLYLSEERLGEQAAFARPSRKAATPGQIHAGAEPKPMAAAEDESEEEEESGEEMSFADAAELFRQGDYLAAIDAFTRVLSKQPGLREAVEYQKLAYYNQGLAYMKAESYAEALKVFEPLRKMQPDFKRLGHYMQTAREKLADQHHLAGIRHFKEQKLQEAIEEWNQALALNPRLDNARRSQERARRLLKSLEEIK